MLPDIQPGNTKILYFFNCLLDGMHTKIKHICDFSRCRLNVRVKALASNLCSEATNMLYLSKEGCVLAGEGNSIYSKILPSIEIVTTCHGINFPLFFKAVTAACSNPPQQGTSIRTIVTLLISLAAIISVSFSL